MARPKAMQDHGGRRYVQRPDGVQVRAYAPGDGRLSFVAAYQGNAAGCANPTEAECKAACPDGWQVYADGPYWRAKPA